MRSEPRCRTVTVWNGSLPVNRLTVDGPTEEHRAEVTAGHAHSPWSRSVAWSLSVPIPTTRHSDAAAS